MGTAKPPPSTPPPTSLTKTQVEGKRIIATCRFKHGILKYKQKIEGGKEVRFTVFQIKKSFPNSRYDGTREQQGSNESIQMDEE
ncbi:Hypothetical predicted protein [Octopus vulgaris]|uniref:Uncharacterized protein n=1 Tax=Octopus vulgaris TaxID=6645 RepID=A0AA36F2V0_OCTVU|nr:Hypothetical predicted protein [Octopus vulgaris]